MKFLMSAITAIIFALCAISAHAQCNQPYCNPTTCFDTSGSATAQSCTTPGAYPLLAVGGPPSPFVTTLTAGNTIVYSTTTANTGDLTINVNGTGAVHIRKWQGSATLAAGDLVANIPTLLTYDGTYWEMYSIGNPPSGGGGSAPFNAMLAPSSVTPPVMSGFTYGSAGTTGYSCSNSTNAGGAVWLTCNSGSFAGTNVNFYFKSAPTPPWTLTFGYVPVSGTGTYNSTGLFLRESSTGKIAAIETSQGSSQLNMVIYLQQLNSYTSFGSNYQLWVNPSPVVWERLMFDGTTYTIFVSPDGQNFLQLHAFPATSYFTAAADEIGFGFDISDPSLTFAMLVLDWAGI